MSMLGLKIFELLFSHSNALMMTGRGVEMPTSVTK